MRTLVIDCATEACSVALFDNDELMGSDYAVLGRGHAEALVPMIGRLPGRGQSDRIAVSLGPGSFTGVRVGVAAARALAFAWGAKLQGYTTLALVAAMARGIKGAVPLCVAMSGGHGEWFIQPFTTGGRSAEPLASLAPEAAAERGEQLIAGSVAERLVSLRGFGEGLFVLPDARSFGLLDETWLMDEVRPLYGRAPDAKLPVSRP